MAKYLEMAYHSEYLYCDVSLDEPILLMLGYKDRLLLHALLSSLLSGKTYITETCVCMSEGLDAILI